MASGSVPVTPAATAADLPAILLAPQPDQAAACTTHPNQGLTVTSAAQSSAAPAAGLEADATAGNATTGNATAGTEADATAGNAADAEAQAWAASNDAGQAGSDDFELIEVDGDGDGEQDMGDAADEEAVIVLDGGEGGEGVDDETVRRSEEQEEDPPNKKAAHQCEMCDEAVAKYCCPGCSCRTCSLACSKEHKVKRGCSGQRDRLGFVPMAEFGDRQLMSDYRWLEEVARADDTARRCRPPAPKPQLPPHLSNLVYQAERRRIQLLIMPPGMHRRITNSTRYDGRLRKMSWRVEWVFGTAGKRVVDEQVAEDAILKEVLSRHITWVPGSAARQAPLAAYTEAGVDELKVYLRKERTPANSPAFYAVDCSRPLGSQLAGKMLVEFPVFIVALPGEEANYPSAFVNRHSHQPPNQSNYQGGGYQGGGYQGGQQGRGGGGQWGGRHSQGGPHGSHGGRGRGRQGGQFGGRYPQGGGRGRGPMGGRDGGACGHRGPCSKEVAPCSNKGHPCSNRGHPCNNKAVPCSMPPCPLIPLLMRLPMPPCPCPRRTHHHPTISLALPGEEETPMKSIWMLDSHQPSDRFMARERERGSGYAEWVMCPSQPSGDHDMHIQLTIEHQFVPAKLVFIFAPALTPPVSL